MTTTETNATPSPTPPAPKTRRPRGPNKPKIQDATITVKIEAVISQAEIIKLLTAHVVKMVDKETAAKMELQLNLDGKGWVTMDQGQSGADASRGGASAPKLRFATKEVK
jgi:heme-binding NEAT domain protein